MPLARDLSDLPKAPGAGGAKGWKPDDVPRFGPLLLEAWRLEEEQRPIREQHSDFRHSDAGACARAIAYAALRVEHSNPMDLSGIFITTQGSIIHEQWQKALQAHFGNEVEIEVKLRVDRRGGHIDAKVIDPIAPGNEKITVIEAKTLGGFAYKQAVGCPPVRRVPDGPKYGHVLQAAINGLDANADEVVILYMTREAISVGIARDKGFDETSRVLAEWTLPREVYEPLARKELERIDGILALIDEGQLPRRIVPDPEMPHRHLIVRPADGSYVEYDADGAAVDAGSYWGCNYCKWQDFCATTPAERTPIDEVLER